MTRWPGVQERLAAALRNPAAMPLLLCVVALATRFQQFGNPIYHVDDQFYLLVGDRMWSGAIPYVDIWDRKPVGLFLLYAAMRGLGGDGILAYQLVATGFAIATAWVVGRIARRIAGAGGALLSAILYLLWLPLITGQGGQSPVFYNLLVALAALATIRAHEDRRAVSRGLAAMLLVGVAMQIKYNALFEGIFFGVTLMLLLHRQGARWPGVLAAALLWIAAALLPTVLAGLAYWHLGHFDIWWFSNFVSIFQRQPLGTEGSIRNALSLTLYVAPLIVTAARGADLRWRRHRRDLVASVVLGWLIAAILSVAIFGYYLDHYALPLTVPAAVSAATVLGDRRHRVWTWLVMGGAALGCILVPHVNEKKRGTPAQFAALVRVVRPLAPHGLLVWDKLPALYTATGAPLPGRWPFPNHLRDSNEIGAVGVYQRAELLRILRNRPAAIVIEREGPQADLTDNSRILQAWLARAYHPIATVRVGKRAQIVYAID